MQNEVSPLNYDIRLDVDLVGARFQGSVIVRFRAEASISEVVMNLVELDVSSCWVGDETLDPCTFEILAEEQLIKIFLPRPARGEVSCHIDFQGKLLDSMIGFYRSKHLSDAGVEYLAVTQFEENEARRAFPCFDHPSMKATFDVLLVVDQGHQAVSNARTKEERLLENGRKAVRFHTTPRMSTYLLFFGVGPFRELSDPGRVTMRALGVTDKIERARFGLDFGRKSLTYLEVYTGLEFPIPKLDLIGIPDFAFGAMENWGAITFRENLLLRDPGSTSRVGEERICEVIAHEIAHQWFGNLVTPFTWNELWLNESFATYFAFRVLDEYHPEWQAWDRFLEGQVRSALERDALTETFAIEIPDSEEVVINASTAPIIYNKGGAVLRQLQAYMGEEEFQAGVRSYLSTHAYECASSSSAWDALEKVSSRPARSMIKGWVGQPGFPLLKVGRDSNGLTFYQERFSYLPMESEAIWQIPVQVLAFLEDGKTTVLNTVLEERAGSLSLDRDVVAYKVNYGQQGFFRVRYEEERMTELLGRAIKDLALPAPDRWGLQDDLYALLMSGSIPLSKYLEFIQCYNDEVGYLPLVGIGENLLHAWLVHEGNSKRLVAETARGLLEGSLHHIGMEPKGGESLSMSRLRDQLLWVAASFGCPDAVSFGLERFEALEKGETVHPDILGAVLRIAAREYGNRAFEWFEDRLARSESEFERTTVLEAMGCFGDDETVLRTLSYVLDRVPARNKFVPVAKMAQNPAALTRLWDWFSSNYERISNFHPLHYERIITYTVPLSGLGREEEVKDFFTRGKGKARGRGSDVIRLSLEKLRVNERMRACEG